MAIGFPKRIPLKCKAMMWAWTLILSMGPKVIKSKNEWQVRRRPIGQWIPNWSIYNEWQWSKVVQNFHGGHQRDWHNKFIREKEILSFNRSSSVTNISHPPQQFNSMVPFDAVGPHNHALINQFLLTLLPYMPEGDIEKTPKIVVNMLQKLQLCNTNHRIEGVLHSKLHVTN